MMVFVTGDESWNVKLNTPLVSVNVVVWLTTSGIENVSVWIVCKHDPADDLPL